MAYSRADELAAQDKLAQIWQVSDRSERIALAERFGYGGTDASKLRAMRRLLTGNLQPGEYAVITDYFAPYVTQEDKEVWRGRLPPFTIQDNHIVVSQVMYVAIIEGDAISWEANLNPGVTSKDINTLFESYAAAVDEKMGQSANVSGRIEGIAFSSDGARQLADYVERGFDSFIGVPRADYGVALVPTKGKYVEGKRKPLTPQTFQRPLPKAKRDDMIRYANRAYGQYRRKGGRLA